MNVTSIEQEVIDGYPILSLIVDGRSVVWTKYEKLYLTERYGIVSLGDEFSEKRVTIPADPELGQPEQELIGVTDDPEIVQIFVDWINGFDIGKKVVVGEWER